MALDQHKGAASPGAQAADAAPEPDVQESSRAVELVCAAIALVINAAVVWGASNIALRGEAGGIDPRWWPTALSLLGLGLAVALLIVALANKSQHSIQPMNAQGVRGLVLVGAATVVFVFAWDHIPFLAAAAVYLLSLLLIFGERRWKVLILFPVGMASFVYFMFHTLLQVPL